MTTNTSEKKPAIKPKRWLNRNILGMGLASLFSDMNHEMASAVLPMFLSSVLGAPAFALGVIEGVADGVSTIFDSGQVGTVTESASAKAWPRSVIS